MKGAIEVIQPGLSTTIQDLGRTGGQSLGIPVSGAADPVALRAANVVVGNPQSVAGLEIALIGPVLVVRCDSIRVAIAGGDSHLLVEREGAAGQRVPTLTSVRLVRGDRLRVPAIAGSAVAYLAIEGGLALPPVLGSLSTYGRAGLGGISGRGLAAGDTLPLLRTEVDARVEMTLSDLPLKPVSRIRVVLGPQDDYFTPAGIETFLGATYVVSREADRMGMRLEGPVIEHAKGYNIVSDGTAPGSIQVPGSGLPIVLLSDRQSTGGYPKIATVASVDLPALGRAGPGMRLKFEAISVAAATAARRADDVMLRALPGRLRPAGGSGVNLERLYDQNLVSGVFDAGGPAA